MSSINSVMNLAAVNLGEFVPVDSANLQPLSYTTTHNTSARKSMFDVDVDQLEAFHAAFEANEAIGTQSIDPALLDSSKHMRLYNKLFVK